MKKYNFFKQDAKRPTEEQRLQTKLFYENAGEIYALFDKWKVVDRQAQSPMAMAQRMTGMRICRNDFMAFMLLCKVSEKA